MLGDISAEMKAEMRAQSGLEHTWAPVSEASGKEELIRSGQGE